MLASLTFAGCSTGGPLARWGAATDSAISPAPKADEAGDTRGRIARLLAPEGAPHKVDMNVQPASLLPPTEIDPTIVKEFEAAEEHLAAGRLDEAERAFTNLDRRRERGSLPERLGLGKKKDDDKTIAGILRKTQPGWGERALYYLAETQYKQGKLVTAHDTIDKLLVNYPGSKYLDQLVAREYEIAMTWLKAIDPKSKPEDREKWNDRATGRLPAFDVSGHALQALEHVRQHDVAGPYADKSVMHIADFHYERENYEEASEYYDQLIESHPKSELAYDAYRKTIDSKLKAYIGPKYDPTGLAKAKDQVHQVMTLYPERHATNSENLSHTLDLIEDQEAEQAFRRGEFYKQTGYPGAAELCYGELKTRWPQSNWTKLAQGRLEEIARMPRKVVEPSKIMSQPGANDPFASGLNSGTTPGATSPLGSQGGP